MKSFTGVAIKDPICLGFGGGDTSSMVFVSNLTSLFLFTGFGLPTGIGASSLMVSTSFWSVSISNL